LTANNAASTSTAAVTMPFTYSIATGIGLGFITYALAKIISGKLGQGLLPALFIGQYDCECEKGIERERDRIVGVERITSVDTADAMQVATNTAPLSMPALLRIVGLTKTM
jgi:hypothetical protein